MSFFKVKFYVELDGLSPFLDEVYLSLVERLGNGIKTCEMNSTNKATVHFIAQSKIPGPIRLDIKVYISDRNSTCRSLISVKTIGNIYGKHCKLTNEHDNVCLYFCDSIDLQEIIISPLTDTIGICEISVDSYNHFINVCI